MLCETTRPFKIMEGLSEEIGDSPLIFVRMNVDPFKIDNKKQKLDRRTRYERFKTFYETVPKPDCNLTVQYMFYDTDNQGKLMVEQDPDFIDCLKRDMLPPITS